MTENFVPRSSVHSYGTRFRENKCVSLPKVHLHIGVVLYVTIYNIKSKVEHQNFKAAVKLTF